VKISNDAAAMIDFMEELYPFCRSITGDGVRQTLEAIAQHVPLTVVEVPSGTQVFDWTVPPEWNIQGGYLQDPAGDRIVDFADHNLHILNYSTPVDIELSLEELQPHLFSDPEWPRHIPYRTSYYAENWGFCLRHSDREALQPGQYRAVIDSTLSDGYLTLGEFLVPGQSDQEVLIYTHTCHPSLANDNLSGIATTVWWAKHLATKDDLYYSYRFVWGPGAIGSITWLAKNQDKLDRIRHGIGCVLMGRPGRFVLKQGRRSGEVEQVCRHVLSQSESGLEVREFDPYGYDERQFCSPGINLDYCRLSRAANDDYPEYHSSADDMSLIDAGAMAEALESCKAVSDALDANRTYINTAPMCEPQLGKRGLYGATGGTSPKEHVHAMLWVLNQSDGEHSLLDIAERAGLPFATIHAAASDLTEAGLLRFADERG
jgi:aminopeptidase-like protein